MADKLYFKEIPNFQEHLELETFESKTLELEVLKN